MRLSEATVAISGLGLMGGSLALALRGKCRTLIGVVRSPELCKRALRTGVVDHATLDLAEAASQADITVLATPVLHVIESIPCAAASMRPGALLLDLASTKREVVAAMNAMPTGVLAVGGHPMCGKETTGLESAEPGLFRGATFVLTPTERTSNEAMSLSLELVESIGAHPLILDAVQHDRAVAVISHLPYLLSAALVHTEEQERKKAETVQTLAAGGFRDTTRLAAGSVEMMLDIMSTNRDEVERALDMFEASIREARSLLGDPEGLARWMAQARDARKGMFT